MSASQPGAGPPLRTPAFTINILGKNIQVFFEKPWITWLNQLRSDVTNQDDLALLADRGSVTAAPQPSEDAIVAARSSLAAVDALIEQAAALIPATHAGDAARLIVMIELMQMLSPPAQRNWVDYVMREAGGAIKLEGDTAAFPALRRSPTTPVDTQSVLADKSALTGHEVLDELYGGDWNGKIEVPTKNAVYDKIAALFPTDPPSGIYTPVLTNVANVAASTAYECQYVRVGNVVTVSGQVDIDPVAGAATCQLGISLPIASNFDGSNRGAGTAFMPAAGYGGALLADIVNKRMELDAPIPAAGDVANHSWWFIFSYAVE
jgi:hypothetical protein